MTTQPDESGGGEKGLVLLTGATGYVGGRLLRRLQAAGWPLRCLARRPEFLAARLAPGTAVVQGDLLDPSAVAAALAGVSVAYYLAHSMGESSGFEVKERRAAEIFAAAAHTSGVRRIVYLGGLGGDAALSPHLASRQAVGRILRDSGVPTIELQASIIIGSGSLSFELVRALVNKLPVMVTPRWLYRQAQPIAIGDVLAYLEAALELPGNETRVFEIGGAERISYAGLMREYARQRGLRRLMLPVPVLSPRLSSLWLGLVTPVYARVGRKLIDSIRHDTVVRDDAALRAFDIRPVGVAAAIERALANEDRSYAETRWSDALSSAGEPRNFGGMRYGARLLDTRSAEVVASPEAAFRPIEGIGGRRGWYFGNFLWRLRGFVDLLVGGVGLRRGRRDPDHLAPGDALDFWRVEDVQPPRLLRLAAEMRLPGRAWLQFEVEPTERGSVIRQTALFDPAGLGGLLYWYGIWPLHALVFRGLFRALLRRAARGG